MRLPETITHKVPLKRPSCAHALRSHTTRCTAARRCCCVPAPQPAGATTTQKMVADSSPQSHLLHRLDSGAAARRPSQAARLCLCRGPCRQGGPPPQPQQAQQQRWRRHGRRQWPSGGGQPCTHGPEGEAACSVAHLAAARRGCVCRVGQILTYIHILLHAARIFPIKIFSRKYSGLSLPRTGLANPVHVPLRWGLLLNHGGDAFPGAGASAGLLGASGLGRWPVEAQRIQNKEPQRIQIQEKK